MGPNRRLVLFLVLALLVVSGTATATNIVMETPLGTIKIELFDNETPITVANFLNYVTDGDYVDTFVHRSELDFVIQGGGFSFTDGTITALTPDPPIVNEFNRSNTRGTIAMAKQSGDPNSATSQWFINLSDNSALDTVANGQFTVFGQVTEGLAVLDAINGLQRWNFNDPSLTSVPLIDYSVGDVFGSEHLVFTQIEIEVLDGDDDGLIDAEDNCPDIANINQTDTDDDSIGDACDDDDDNDGLSDDEEAVVGTDPLDPDTDGDGTSDGDEVASGSNPLVNERAAMSWLPVLLFSDSQPRIIGLGSSVSVAENGTLVVRVNASDDDNDALTYRLTGTDASSFQISTSGVIRFKSAPDYESKTSYSVRVVVSDGSYTTTRALTINITNVNDNTPVITSSGSFSAAENQTAVGTVEATDPDGDDLTYSLSGDDAGSFSIDSSGVLTFDSAPDFETKSTYEITVEVSDGTNTDSQDLTINIINVNDNDPAITSSAIFSAAENQTVVGAVEATDVDGDDLTFSLSGADADSFSIDSSGVLTFDSAPDYETKSSYGVTVEVDDGSNTVSQDLTVDITNIPDIWVQRGDDIDSESADDESGYWISLSEDGNTVAIGAYSNDDNGSNAGQVRIYDWDDDAWTQRGDDINGEAAYDRSGISLSMGADGDTVAISADGNAGQARIYDWSDDAWIQRGAEIDGSGQPVSLSADGDTVAIGAPLGGNNAGHVRIYDWSDDAWTKRGDDIDGEAAGDRSGYSVSLSADGDAVAIGAIYNDAGGSDAGHVRIYDWSDDAWTQRGDDIDGEVNSGYVGWSVSMSNVGDTVVIAALNVCVCIYDWDGSSWAQRGDDIDPGAYNRQTVSMSTNGDTVAIGGWGYAYIYDWTDDAWSQRGERQNGRPSQIDGGSWVSLSADGNTVAIGDEERSFGGYITGKVRIYDWQ